MPSYANVAARDRGSRGKTTSKSVAVPQVPPFPRPTAAVPVQHPSAAIMTPNLTPQTHPGPSHLPTQQQSANQSHTNAVAKASPTSSERVDWEYDVYATPFVPSQLRMINLEEPGSVIGMRSQHQVDYEAYTAAFAGTSFLPERQRNTRRAEQKGFHTGYMTAQSYFHHLTALWELECVAKEQENEENALYKVTLYYVQKPRMKPLWTLTVPGLRDDSPFLEKGDVLQLRQLWVDATNNVIQMPMQVEDAGYGHVRWVYKSWTGVQHDTCIVNVNRKEEIVYLEAQNLAPLHVENVMLPMVVNVRFPMKHPSLEAQRMALVYISLELEKVTSPLSIKQASNLLIFTLCDVF